MKKTVIVWLVVFLVILGGCSSESSVPELSNGPIEDNEADADETPPATEPIDLVFDVDVNCDGGIIEIIVTSNFPDGIKISGSVESNGYKAQDGGELANGSLQLGPFSDSGNSLPDGDYIISVSTPITSTQSDAVKDAVGVGYENYKSDLFINEDSTRRISYEMAAVVESGEIVTLDKAAEDMIQIPEGLSDIEVEIFTLIAGDVGRYETITNVSLADEVLTITVDMSDSDPSPLTAEMAAESRVESITDTILANPELDELWGTITLDFGDIGSISFTHDDITSNEYGRYFDIPLDPFAS